MSFSDTLAQTPLHALHLEQGARMVEFAGYQMPVQYPAGVLREHLHSRAQAGLFDVSHMGQIILRGPRAAAGLERLVPVDVLGLTPGSQRYALFTDEHGGILDDLMIANAGHYLYLVVNAACKQADLQHLQQHLRGVEIEARFDSHALLALQGPAAEQVLARLAPQVRHMAFMQFAELRLLGVDCLVSRSGYTGEDGFEIAVPARDAEMLARSLLAEDEVALVGLGARDSLRLEAGLCLYGHDMDTQTTPIEASLGWAISAARREGGARAGGYPGAERIQRQQREGVEYRRVGLLPEERTPVREGCELVDSAGQVIGRVTSGGFAPSLGVPIAMGYLANEQAGEGNQVAARVRGRHVPLRVARLPFVTPRYVRKPA